MITMDLISENDENPLLLSNFPIGEQCKSSGRPRKSEKILFSPPPKSIVSLLLSKSPDIVVELSNSSPDNLHYNNTNDTNIATVCEKDKEWVCRQCSFRCDNKDLLRRHKATHKINLHKCDFVNCKYSTKLSSNLIKHKRSHTAEKPYICDKCIFRTNFQNSLTVHKRIHTSEKPYACKHCEYRCNSSSNLKKHCRHRHLKGA